MLYDVLRRNGKEHWTVERKKGNHDRGRGERLRDCAIRAKCNAKESEKKKEKKFNRPVDAQRERGKLALRKKVHKLKEK